MFPVSFKTYGSRLKYLRFMRKMDQRDVARQCRIAASRLSALENNKCVPTLGQAFSLAKFYDVPVDVLFEEICKE